MEMKKDISSSLEDYLEAIYLFSEKGNEVRAGQIALHLNVKKSSVTEALQNLSKGKLINYKPYNPITLTEYGKIAAENILRRHNIVKDFFRDIMNLSDDEASNTACKIEHVISDELASRLDKLSCILKNEEILNKIHKSF